MVSRAFTAFFAVGQLLLFTTVSCLYEAGSSVKLLNAKQFDTLRKSGEPFLVEFFSSGCGHCVQFVPEYEKAAKALQDIVKVVATDDRDAMSAENVGGFPTVKFIRGKASSDAEEYKGDRKATELATFVLKQLKKITDERLSGKKSGGSGGSKAKSGDKKSGSGQDKDVIVLSDSNFEKLVSKEGNEEIWLVEFYAPWCGHCTALEPTWNTLASNLKGKVKVAKVDATANELLARHFGIQGFPTIKLFPPFGERKWIDMPNRAVPYEGGRSIDELTNFALQYAGAAANADQLVTQDMFEERCKKGVCIIAFLPNILDSKAAGREDTLKSLNNVLRATFSMPVTFLWAEGGANFDFEDKLNLAFGFPAVVALNLEKKRFAVHKGAYTEDALRQFITGMMAGRVSVKPMPQNLPKIATTEPWDGKDAVQPPEEDLDEEL